MISVVYPKNQDKVSDFLGKKNLFFEIFYLLPKLEVLKVKINE